MARPPGAETPRARLGLWRAQQHVAWQGSDDFLFHAITKQLTQRRQHRPLGHGGHWFFPREFVQVRCRCLSGHLRGLSGHEQRGGAGLGELASLPLHGVLGGELPRGLVSDLAGALYERWWSGMAAFTGAGAEEQPKKLTCGFVYFFAGLVNSFAPRCLCANSFPWQALLRGMSGDGLALPVFAIS